MSVQGRPTVMTLDDVRYLFPETSDGLFWRVRVTYHEGNDDIWDSYYGSKDRVTVDVQMRKENGRKRTLFEWILGRTTDLSKRVYREYKYIDADEVTEATVTENLELCVSNILFAIEQAAEHNKVRDLVRGIHGDIGRST